MITNPQHVNDVRERAHDLMAHRRKYGTLHLLPCLPLVLATDLKHPNITKKPVIPCSASAAFIPMGAVLS
jgi:hypothetical protein